jgi:hypothetical protein
MKLAAVIIDNRPNIDILSIIERHRKFLPKDTQFIADTVNPIKSERDYNYYITDPKFWAALLEFDRVLIFQHDSGLLREGIEEFYQFDYVGAPWVFQLHGGNGGLSLRNPRIMYHICQQFPYKGMSVHGNEDVYFCNKMKEANGCNGLLAPREVCSQFSVESIYKLGTFGYHAIDKWLTPTQCNNILNQYK